MNNKLMLKRTKENPHYKHVQPKVDTGQTVKKFIDTLRHKSNNKHSNEVFGRMRVSEFVELVLCSNSEDPVSKDNNNEEPTEAIAESSQNGAKEGVDVPKTPLLRLLHGIGEKDDTNEKESKPVTKTESTEEDKLASYLLLDVRQDDQYEKCHIITADNYSHTLLSREREPKHIYRYKRQLNIPIILYDEEEHFSPHVAKTLYQRGYENLCILSGGLKLASQKFPCGLVVRNTHEKGDFTPEDIATLQATMVKHFGSNPELKQHEWDRKSERSHTGVRRSTNERPKTSVKQRPTTQQHPWK